MKKPMIYFLTTVLISLSAWSAQSHRPVIVKEEVSREKPVIVEEPEISWAYYGTLEGEPHYFKILSSEGFNLYMNILVPDFDPEGKPIKYHDMSIEILRDDELIYREEGLDNEWMRFYEKYGRDHYYWGPEYDRYVEGGTYFIKVFNSMNSGRYSIAIGKIEKFTIPIFIDALFKAKSLDRWFFKEDE
jgi:hypothetical protein